MRVLVTGGAGYVGSVLVPMLLDDGHFVRVIDPVRAGRPGLLSCCTHQRFDMVRRDMSDEGTLSVAMADVDAVVHLAAIVGQPACEREPAHAWATNVECTRLLLELRGNHQRVVFASTGSVYGKVLDAVCTEQTELTPLTLYGRAKAAAEELVLAAGNSVVYRYATAFGVSPSMRFDLLVNDFVHQAVHRGNLVVYQGQSRRTLVHVRDMARSIVFALRNWDVVADDVYNVGNEALNLSKADIVHAVRRRVNCYLHFADFAEDPDQRDYSVSYEKLRAKGFTADVDLESGLAELVSAASLVA
ncbi:NAD(P)-dependent oxidoreductase [Actinophytocola sp.]|uniref:NAD-dependent epimerase/dehydratase family protein n=1 Tax=Actinophytocola sp. TaxID=1872138 RepID=UPI002ED593AC